MFHSPVLPGTLWLSLALTASVWGGTSFTTDWLRLAVGARPSGMGGSVVAVAEGVSAIYWNPANLGLEERIESQFIRYPSQLSGENRYYLGTTAGLGRWGTMGIGYGRFDDHAHVRITTSLSYGYRALKNVCLGASGKFVKVSREPG